MTPLASTLIPEMLRRFGVDCEYPMDLRDELEALHAPSFGWAMCCCRYHRQEAEDVLQMVYIKVLEGSARFDGRSSLRTWLFGVIRQTARDQSRRQWLRAALLERWYRLEPDAIPENDSGHRLEESQHNRALLAAVQQLPQRQREVLHLVFYQDLTIEESARTLGISLGTARTHFERGKQQLRERLKGGER